MWDDDAANLERARSELAGYGLSADTRLVDVADAEQVQRTYAALRRELGAVAALFNMATLKNTYMLGEHEDRAGGGVPFWQLDLGRLRRAVEVNVLGTIFCSAAVAPDMVAAGGSIVNFSTSPKTQRSPGHIPYGPSKALVEAFSWAAAEQLAPHGVRINVISSAGAVNRRKRSDPDRQPWDWMAELVAYLAGEESRGVSGQSFAGALQRR